MGLRRTAAAALALTFGLALTGCGADGAADPSPDAGATVEIEGAITAITASSGGRSYVLDVSGEGLLALVLPDARPPFGARGVVVEVPEGVDLPAGDHGIYEALAEWVGESDTGLTVVAYL